MQCEEFETRLNDLLDERLPIERDAVLRAHAGACGGCRRLAAGYGALFQGLAGLPSPEGDAALAWRVVSECHALRRRRRAVRYGFAGLAAAAAATVVMAFALRDKGGPQVVDAQPRQDSSRVAATSSDERPLDEGPLPAEAALPPVEAAPVEATALAAADFTDSNAVLARETRQTFAGALLLLPDLPARSAPGGAASADTAAAAGTYEVADELKPLTDSTAGALGFLMNVLPGRGKQPPPAPPGS